MSLSYCHTISHTANPTHIGWLPQGLCFLIRYELQQHVVVQKWSLAKAEWRNLHTASSWVQGRWSSRPGIELQEGMREWHSATQMVRAGEHCAALVVFCIYLMPRIDKRKFPWPFLEGQAIPRGRSGSCGVLKFTVTSLQVKMLNPTRSAILPVWHAEHHCFLARCVTKNHFHPIKLHIYWAQLVNLDISFYH